MMMSIASSDRSQVKHVHLPVSVLTCAEAFRS